MKILVTDEISQEGLQPLLDDPRMEIDVRLGLPVAELHQLIGAYDALITRSGTNVNPALIDHGRNLKIIARAGVGIDNVDVDYASQKGIIVVNAPYGNVNSAAEHTMALLLSLCRNVPAANASLKSGAWKRAPFTGYEVKGKTVGIIGLGKVGGRVATRCKAFEADVIAYDPYIAEKRGDDLGVKLVTLEEIIRYADIITVHTPLNAETRGIINATHFPSMKDGVIIINCARGGIIDEEAMLAALDSGKICGSGFDVWSEEPPATETLKSLIGHAKMIVTPHLGANTFEAQKNVAVDVSRELVSYLDGRPIENAVNIPKFDPDLLEHMKPFLDLIQQMGRFLSQLAPAHASKVTFIYNGKLARYDCAPLTVCGLAALLNRHTEQEVNMVNARIVGESMGIEVEEIRNTETESFSNLITLVIESPEGKRTISGTMFEGIAKIVKLRDFLTDFTPEEHMLVMHYQDRPGMLGKIGTILGESGINIGNMNLGRRKEEGEAMVVFSIDSPLDAATVERIATEIGARFIKQIKMSV